MAATTTQKPRVVIIGAGFAGLAAAKALSKSRTEVVIVDRTNHHLFQPLLYQVATAALSPGDIASPVRAILRKCPNVHVMLDEVQSIDKDQRVIHLAEGDLPYDYLICAPGARHSYFGKDEWEKFAPGLKSLSDALEIREHLLLSFEHAERVYGRTEAAKYLTFVIVGGGPTGVELAGAIAEIAEKTMLPDFPLLRESDVRVLLVEAGPRILSTYPAELSARAQRDLEKLGVSVLTGTPVTDITAEGVTIGGEFIETVNVIWAAGNAASPLLRTLEVPLDRQGRALVEHDCSIPGHPEVFVIGDAACFAQTPDGAPLPGVAPVAVQQGRYVAAIIRKALPAPHRKPFKYLNKGNMATIGRAKAIATFGRLQASGLAAWLMWCFIHVFFLVDFRNRVRVLIEWLWYFVTFQPGARLVVRRQPEHLAQLREDEDEQDTPAAERELALAARRPLA